MSVYRSLLSRYTKQLKSTISALQGEEHYYNAQLKHYTEDEISTSITLSIDIKNAQKKIARLVKRKDNLERQIKTLCKSLDCPLPKILRQAEKPNNDLLKGQKIPDLSSKIEPDPKIELDIPPAI